MSCPYFRENYFALCARSDSPYVPSIAEMEDHCFKEEFYSCPIIEASSAKDEPEKYKKKQTWLNDLYSESLYSLCQKVKTESK
jgi:hypothetical protein